MLLGIDLEDAHETIPEGVEQRAHYAPSYKLQSDPRIVHDLNTAEATENTRKKVFAHLDEIRPSSLFISPSQ